MLIGGVKMTRVIKFRAWDGYSMLKDVQTWTDDFTDMLNETFKMWANPELSQHLKLMQFTGLVDKNGKEVFEGDVVRSYQTIIDERTLINTVIFKNGGFYLNCEKQLDYLLGDYDPQFIEIVGNIYENGDLLNDK